MTIALTATLRNPPGGHDVMTHVHKRESMTATFRLDDEFIAGYAATTPPFGFNGLGYLAYLRTYSRLKEDGTQERWFETCRRVVEGTYRMQERWVLSHRLPWKPRKAQRSAREMYDRMFHMKFLPPGRGLWAMGSELTESRCMYAALLNCFDGSTPFITRHAGVQRLDALVGESVEVLTAAGWARAEIRAFGTQEVRRITFAPAAETSRGSSLRALRSNHRVTVTATPDHRWELADGTLTTSLAVGDFVPAQANAWVDTESGSYRSGFLHGVIFGDGSRSTWYEEPMKFSVRLCGKKADMVGLFDHATYPPSCGGDPIATVDSDTDLKALPVYGYGGECPEYVAGFIEGWMATDGGAHGRLSTQDHEAADWLHTHAALGGYVITGDNTESVLETNYGPRAFPLRRLTLRRSAGAFWKVVAVEDLAHRVPVYCAVVPEVERFTLAAGIYTSNCGFASTDQLQRDPTEPFCFLMEASMLGIGVGFDTKGAGQVTVLLPQQAGDYVIPDTREGWVESVRRVLASFLVPDTPCPVFDYSEIRPAGAPIRGFGGVAAGPEPLKRLHLEIEQTLFLRVGSTITSRDITDLMNVIGKCVVAGNVRRTAEIAFGAADDEDFLDLKNYDLNPWRESYGWTSNNSVFATLGMDYAPVAQRVARNGEPGFAWLDNMREYGRMADPATNSDWRVAGTNPCVEQSLESYECCNLVETFPANHDSLEDYERTLKFAYLYAKTVTLGTTPWSKTNQIMLRNRRIGLSQSGIQQAVAKLGIEEYRRWCDAGYKTVRRYDDTYSEWLGIPRSIKVTSVKPSGTVSLLAGATPGMHWPEARHYIRRMRLSALSDLIPALVAAGYDVEPAFGSEDTTVVVSVPVEVGGSVRTVGEVTMWEQLAMAAFLQKYWSDNQVSATITFDPEREGPQIAHALSYYQYQLKGVSFLPRLAQGAYRQMPYQEISADTYRTLAARLKPIQFAATHETAEAERFCDGSACTIG